MSSCAIVSGFSRSGVIFSLLLLVNLIFSFGLDGLGLTNENGVNGEMVPMNAVEEMVMVPMNESRRRLGSFQICALCTCCGGGGKGYCLPSPCCYAINCNIPNRPFGFCAFTPKTCNCFQCHL